MFEGEENTFESHTSFSGDGSHEEVLSLVEEHSDIRASSGTYFRSSDPVPHGQTQRGRENRPQEARPAKKKGRGEMIARGAVNAGKRWIYNRAVPAGAEAQYRTGKLIEEKGDLPVLLSASVFVAIALSIVAIGFIAGMTLGPTGFYLLQTAVFQPGVISFLAPVLGSQTFGAIAGIHVASFVTRQTIGRVYAAYIRSKYFSYEW
jgi:hypothetical protein